MIEVWFAWRSLGAPSGISAAFEFAWHYRLRLGRRQPTGTHEFWALASSKWLCWSIHVPVLISREIWSYLRDLRSDQNSFRQPSLLVGWTLGTQLMLVSLTSLSLHRSSPYFDIHHGLTLAPAYVGYDGSGNATHFRAVFHAPNGFLSRSIISWQGMLNFPGLRKYVACSSALVPPKIRY